MRVLIVVPTYLYKSRYPAFVSNTEFPVGLAYLASALRNAGHMVFGLNPNNDPGHSSAREMLQAAMSRSLIECDPQLVCLGGLCTDFAFLRDAIRIIRDAAPEVPIVCGGGIIGNDARFVFETLAPDFCIIGEGEEGLVQLAGLIEAGDRDYERIPNLGYWKDGRAAFTREDFAYPDLDARAFPDYEPFNLREMLDGYGLAARYLYRYRRAYPRPMTIVTARGCPFSCTFCVHRKGPGYRARSVANVIREIEVLYELYHFNILIILDELFAAKKERLTSFCIELMERRESMGWDFDWLFQTHASASLTPEELKTAREAGCYFFSYGLESASPRVLASLNKKARPQQFVEAIRNAGAARVGFGGNFIFGDVAETPHTVAETMEFVIRHCLPDHVYLSSVQPYPGSKLFDYCIERGIIADKLQFYEHIDEGIYNMTSMPDRLWLPWLHRANLLGRSLPWAKAADAIGCSREPDPGGDPMLASSGKTILSVTARCPHCGAEVRRC